VALAIGLACEHSFVIDEIASSLFAVVPALLGMWIGQRISGRISPTTLRGGFFICMLALGLQLLLRHFI
jgi:uncharacterized protein